MIKEKCIQKSPRSFSLKNVSKSKDSSETHGNFLTVIHMKGKAKSKAGTSNIQSCKTYITIPKGRKWDTVRKYCTKARLKYNKETSKSYSSMSLVKGFRWLHSLNFAPCLSLGWFHFLHAALFDRDSMTLASSISWSYQFNSGFTFTTLCNVP